MVKLFENRTNIDREDFENTNEDDEEVTIDIIDLPTTISTLDAEIITDGTESVSHRRRPEGGLFLGERNKESILKK